MDSNRLTKLIDEKRKELKLSETSVWSGSQPKIDCPVISTGSLALDLAMGVGGFPAGRIIQLAGAEGSGKSLLSLHVVREVQKLGKFGVYVDVERSFSIDWAKGFGVDPERLVVLQPEEGKTCFEFLLGSRVGEGILFDPDWYTDLGVIVLDSLAMVIPPQEYDEDDLGKQQISPLARFLTPITRKLVPVLHNTGVMMVVVNQLREKVGVLWGDPTSTPGGRAFKHACSVMISLASLSGKDSIFSDKSGVRIGHLVRCRVSKNKVAMPFKQATFRVYYKTGIDRAEEVFEYGVKFGLIKKVGSVYTIEGVVNSIKGKPAVIAFLNGTPEAVQSIEAHIRSLSSANATVIDTISAEEDLESEDLTDDEEESIKEDLDVEELEVV